MPLDVVPHLVPGLVVGLLCALLAVPAPALLARVPEPAPEEPAADATAPEEAGASGTTLGPPPPKEPYAEMAALPHLRTGLVVGSGLVGAAFGAVLGWTGALLFLVPLVPVGAVLLVVDWRTTLLPTRIIRPTYVLLAVLVPLAALVDGDLDALLRAGGGWLVVGGWFWVFWWLLGAWGFGDVRLSRVLGPALGYLGWSQALVGLGLMVLVGALGGVVLSLASRSLRRRYPYGPFMLVGAALAVVAGPAIAAGLGY
ncbi:leader peptidase (prepilin peptidase) / N-methyltransferase [Nocardioides scoriae]|uniref:Leader peptidase (Prepilin peptidase) / N-methyltransferase n=1 Tax=Nocardioides scoriae TaxID=642780 RepID=A0A1H1N1F3_9ACTN|nr:A24 family peptidase [Nocardioides scoriae]SDR92792.1 leader peptidase (prepilin peptidase) / N-methyltransferase [Nocardioides scoriae]